MGESCFFLFLQVTDLLLYLPLDPADLLMNRQKVESTKSYAISRLPARVLKIILPDTLAPPSQQSFRPSALYCMFRQILPSHSVSAWDSRVFRNRRLSLAVHPGCGMNHSFFPGCRLPFRAQPAGHGRDHPVTSGRGVL